MNKIELKWTSVYNIRVSKHNNCAIKESIIYIMDEYLGNTYEYAWESDTFDNVV